MEIYRMLSRTLCALSVLLSVYACSGNDNAQTRQVDDYFLTVTTDPEKLAVGSDAEITVNIEKDHEGMGGCHPRFRQYMPAHQMSPDQTWHNLEPLEKGLYRGRGTEFSMGGDWELEFQFNCGDGMKHVVLTYKLVWM